MDPIIIPATIIILACLGAGFGAGWGLKPDATSEALKAHTEALATLTEQQKLMVEQASKPVVIDAETRAALARVPVQCIQTVGGDPNSVQCLWATCIQYGQSSAQRPECRAIEELMITTLKAQQAE